MGETIHSFDVFDTTVIRRVGSPQGVFLLLAERLKAAGLSSLSPRAFLEKRTQAEWAVQPADHRGGPALEDIYREMRALLGWSEAQTREALVLELEVEFSMLVPVASVRERIARARAAGGRIAFLSDMYWPSKQIRCLLDAHGIAAESDIILVSSEARCGKTDGGLFRRMIQDAQVSAGVIYHLGNSLSADVGGARLVGAVAEHFHEGNLTDAEARILGDNGSLWDQCLAGTSRRVRLQYQDLVSDEHRRALTRVVTAVVMPILMNFASWVIRQAARQGVRRLVFISRDGWVLEQCVAKVLQNSKQEILCQFIYGSRQAWHGAAVNPGRLEECTWLFEGGSELTFGRVLSRLNLHQKSAAEYGEMLGLGWHADQVLDAGDIVRLCRAFPNNTEIQSEMQAFRSAVLAYLRQEGLDASTDAAMVDLGWVGRLQGSLNGLLAQVGGPPVRGYYFGLAIAKDGFNGGDRAAFLFDQRNQETRQCLPSGLLQLVESFCTQRHGTTVGYRRAESGRWEPVFRTELNEALVGWGIDHVHEIVRAYLDKFPIECTPSAEPDEVLSSKARRILLRFVNEPDLIEARAWGAFPFEHEQAGGEAISLARAYPKISEGLRIALQGPTGEKLGGYWKAGAQRLTPVLNRYALDIVRKAAFEIRQLRHSVTSSR